MRSLALGSYMSDTFQLTAGLELKVQSTTEKYLGNGAKHCSKGRQTKSGRKYS